MYNDNVVMINPNGELTDNIAARISPWAIALSIISEMVDNGMQPTIPDAEAIWNDFLVTEMHDGLRRRVEVHAERKAKEVPASTDAPSSAGN